MTFNWVDWIILGLIVISCLISIKRGFIKELLSLISWAAAIIIAWMFGGALSVVFADHIETPSVRVIAACITLFIATLLVGALINFILGQLVKATGLSGTDRLLGIAFGAARGLLLVIILVGVVGFAPVREDPWWRDSQLIPHFELMADWSKRTVVELTSSFFEE